MSVRSPYDFLRYPYDSRTMLGVRPSFVYYQTCTTSQYEGCSLILVIDSFSPKPSSLPEENYLVDIDRFFAILKSPTDFKMIQLIMAK